MSATDYLNYLGASPPTWLLDDMFVSGYPARGQSYAWQPGAAAGTTINVAYMLLAPGDYPILLNANATEMVGLTAASAAQKQALEQAAAEWSEYSNLKLVETPAGNTAGIYVGFSTTTKNDATYTHSITDPEHNGVVPQVLNPKDGLVEQPMQWASVWYDDRATADTAPANFLDTPGHDHYEKYSFSTVLHELGHSLGLTHPGTYDAAMPGASDALYAQNSRGFLDNRMFTVMSYLGYNDGSANGWTANGTSSSDLYSATPGILDIAAMQLKYGADYTTRAGDTHYGFNSNAGADYFDFALNPTAIYTIWDGGGHDTLDGSGDNHNQLIDLRPAHYSSMLGLTNNIGIAYGVRIEDGIGGSGNDTLIASDTVPGSTGGSQLWGGAGNDSLVGGNGDDTLHGDAGNDTLVGGQGKDLLDGGAGDDSLSGYGPDTLLGGDGNDRIDYAGAASVDGGAGNDTITEYTYGGGATVFAGAGDDSVSLQAAAETVHGGDGNDTIISDWANSPNQLYGDAGNDNIVIRNNAGSAGADSVYGGTGDDTINVAGSSRSAFIDAGDGANLVWASSHNDTIVTQGSGDTIFGDGGNDSLSLTAPGGDQNESAFLLGGNETISGGAGNSTFQLGDGNNQVTLSGSGNAFYEGNGIDSFTITAGQHNTFHLGSGGNTLFLPGVGGNAIWGAGNVAVNYLSAFAGLSFANGGLSLSDGTLTDALFGVSFLQFTDTVVLRGNGGSWVDQNGSNRDVLLFGDNHGVTAGHSVRIASAVSSNVQQSSSGDWISAGNGDDTVDMLGNNDTVLGGGGQDRITLTGQGNSIVGGSAGDTINITGDYNTINGGNGNNTINLYGFSNTHNNVSAGSGNDAFYLFSGGGTAAGGGGDDFFNLGTGSGAGFWSVDGGAGNDTVEFQAPLANYYLQAQGDGSVKVLSQGTVDLLRNIETVLFYNEFGPADKIDLRAHPRSLDSR